MSLISFPHKIININGDLMCRRNEPVRLAKKETNTLVIPPMAIVFLVFIMIFFIAIFLAFGCRSYYYTPLP